MPAATRKPPSYRLHKATGQGVVTLNGRDVYLGEYGTPDSQQAYDRTIAEWLANGRQLLTTSADPYVTELLAAFLQHATQHYVKPDGSPTSELGVFRQVISLLESLYGSTRASAFGPKALRAVQQVMIDRKWKRGSINNQFSRIKLIFKWAAAREMIPATVYQALTTVDGLRRGRGGAQESEPKTPVPQAHIDAIRPYLSRQVEALMDVQLLTAARGGELVAMRPVDIDTTSDATVDPSERLWFYCPVDHKTAHHGHKRKIYLNARAQAIIAPFLTGRAVDAFLFSPAEAEAERRVQQREERKSPVQPSQVQRAAQAKRRRPKRNPGPCYTGASYRRAIERACLQADREAHRLDPTIPTDQVIVPKWHPHRLRHNAATVIRREFGLELAKIILGHKSVAVTEIYAEADERKAQEAMRRIG